MCGIAGYSGSTDIGRDRIEACLKLMYHRGPDHGIHCEWTNVDGRKIHLLHTRLKIIDLDSRANQPFVFGSKSMIFNGEIYNYLELRDLLVREHGSFYTESDTEVLLRTIDHFGWEGLDRCEGMWALAVFDKTDGSLTLSRDRFGEKPVYVFMDSTGLYFGSEVKFIRCLLGKRLSVNYHQLHRYIVNGYKALYKTEDTFFEGVKELPPGTTLRINSDGTLKNSRYWRPRCDPDESLSYDDAVEGVRERLIRSVKLRLRADVPLAFCMSGGIDSNALIGVARNVFHYDVHGFTIVNSDPRYNEQAVVEAAVKEYGIRHTSIPVNTTDFLPRLRSLVSAHDAPVYTITYYAHWLLMQSIAEHGYRISVSGTAADELFTGYYDHHLAYLFEIRNDRDLHQHSLRAWQEHIRPIVRNPHLGNPDLFISNPGFRSHIFLDAEEFQKYLVMDWEESFSEKTYSVSLLRNRMLNELFHENIPVILHEDDLNAMYFSIENRSPFLDRELFEFSHRIPSHHLIRDGYVKAVLRDAVRGIVPDAVLDNRRKVGFNAPIFSFLDVQAPNVREYLLDRSPIFDYIRRDKIEKLLSKNNVPNSESKFIFYFICSKMFLEEFAA